MAATKRTARTVLYTITLVEVRYDVDEYVDVPHGAGVEGQRMYHGYHLRERPGLTSHRLHILAGRHETRTALLVDVPAADVSAAMRLLDDGAMAFGERYLTSERQRGRIIRDEPVARNRRNRAAA